LMYSFFMEVGQHFVPNRSFSLHDIVANFAGLLIATIILVKCRSN
jgi:VanZ family protein